VTSIAERRQLAHQRPVRIVLALLLTLCLEPCQAIAEPGPGGLRAYVEKERDAAAREVAQARARVKSATEEVTTAKQRLDSLIAQHLDELGRPKAPIAADPSLAGDRVGQAPEASIAQFNQQIEELTARRSELLHRLTAAHPEVVNLDTRIAEISAQLMALKPAAQQRETLPAGEPVAADESVAAKVEVDTRSQQARHREATLAYEQAFRKWELAQHDLELALASQRAADDRLAALPPSEPDVAAAPAAAPTVAPLVAPETVTASSAAPSDNGRGSSQLLAMATLIVALAVAALAAVRLARSSNETLFTNADDITAALALPVVGVIPAVERAAPAGPGSRVIEGAVFLARLLVALFVFALVAYGVQNIAAVGHAVSHPLETLHSVAAYLGVR
jgi:hypothetical protein